MVEVKKSKRTQGIFGQYIEKNQEVLLIDWNGNMKKRKESKGILDFWPTVQVE